MPSLSRSTRPLLRQVTGRPHADQDDHADALPTPPASNGTRSSGSNAIALETEEDINRDPESSDDEPKEFVQFDGRPSFRHPNKILETGHSIPKLPTFKQPPASSPGSLASKRSNSSDAPDSDTEDHIFSSQGSKKPRKAYGANIHAPPPKPRSRPLVYGKGGKQQSLKKQSVASFKKSKHHESEASAPLPMFKQAKGADMFQFTGRDAEPEFQAPHSSGDMRDSRSPSLSSLSSAPSSPGVEEIQTLGLPDARPYVSQVDCTICGQSVDKLRKEEFENQFAPGKRMSYKWQKRFCRFHKREEAKQLWDERGYPQIDWKGLEGRMAKLHPHLEDVIWDKKASIYRNELAERLKGRTMTAKQAVQSADAKGGAPVGYYGPRGEKAMTDHIIAHLSDKLRKQAAKDNLVAASGISGGVSGFIQAVLVPELAVQLMQEDMSVSQARARELVAESAELGDLLNPEIDEKIDKHEPMDED